MASTVEMMGNGYRYIGAHELLRWKRENGIPVSTKLREINVIRKRSGKAPFLVLPARMRMVFR